MDWNPSGVDNREVNCRVDTMKSKDKLLDFLERVVKKSVFTPFFCVVKIKSSKKWTEHPFGCSVLLM